MKVVIINFESISVWKKYFFLALLFSLFSSLSTPLQAQEDINASLARQYYFEGEAEKSIEIYEDLIKKRFVQEYYDNLLDAYYQTDNKSKAEKLIKYAIKLFPTNPIYGADLGSHYLKIDDKAKAEKQFQKVIDNLSANNNDIINLANYFSRRNNYDLSIATFKKGRELLNDNTRFVYELSFLYQRQGRYEDMALEYINLIDNNPYMLNQVKIYIGNLISQDTEGKFLSYFKGAVLKKIQKQGTSQDIAQLYFWILIQDKDYEMAFNQAKSIDKRFENLSGQTVFELASVALNNKIYDISTEAYRYLISKGSENSYYILSRIGILSSLYYPFIASVTHTQKEVNSLKSEYQTTIAEIGKNSNTIPILQQYANLLAYYIHSSQEAVDVLDEILSMKQINRNVKAETKLMRADIYLMENDIWEASLTYSQVEKEFKEDIIGSEAKFKNAMLSYYNGDFEWAAAQFDVLKASTTKLIANDAMEYSLLIGDNIDEDSSYNGLAYYSKAEFAAFQKKYDKAIRYLDTLNQSYLSHPLFDEVLYKRAEIAINNYQYAKADSLLNLILLKYPTDILADDALNLLAELCQTHLNDNKRAKDYYERIIMDYPSSLYVTQARKRYKILKGE